jgi:hypothetical protein
MDFDTAVSASKFEQGKNKAKMGVTTYDSCQREWDIQLLKTCFCNHDFEEINKIRLSEKMLQMATDPYIKVYGQHWCLPWYVSLYGDYPRRV